MSEQQPTTNGQAEPTPETPAAPPAPPAAASIEVESTFALDRKDCHVALDVAGRTLIVRLKWPAPTAFRALFASPKIHYHATGPGQIQMNAGTNPALLKCFDAHVDGMLDHTGKPIANREETLEFCARKSALRIAEHAIARLMSCIAEPLKEAEEHEGDTATLEFLDSLLGDLARYRVSCKLYDPESKASKLFEPVVVMRTPTTRQLQALRAAKAQTNRDLKENEVFEREDPIEVARLFRDRLDRIEGATWKGEPCDPDHDDSGWKDAVPYPWISEVTRRELEAVDLVRPT